MSGMTGEDLFTYANAAAIAAIAEEREFCVRCQGEGKTDDGQECPVCHGLGNVPASEAVAEAAAVVAVIASDDAKPEPEPEAPAKAEAKAETTAKPQKKTLADLEAEAVDAESRLAAAKAAYDAWEKDDFEGGPETNAQAWRRCQDWKKLPPVELIPADVLFRAGQHDARKKLATAKAIRAQNRRWYWKAVRHNDAWMPEIKCDFTKACAQYDQAVANAQFFGVIGSGLFRKPDPSAGLAWADQAAADLVAKEKLRQERMKEADEVYDSLSDDQLSHAMTIEMAKEEAGTARTAADKARAEAGISAAGEVPIMAHIPRPAGPSGHDEDMISTIMSLFSNDNDEAEIEEEPHQHEHEGPEL